jgi:hypothetical protein
MRQALELQNIRPRRREKPYFVWKRTYPSTGGVRWSRWDPPWASYEEAAEAAYRMAGGGRASIDPYFDQKFNELYIGQQSPVDRWGRYKTSALAHRYSKPGRTDYVWAPGRDPNVRGRRVRRKNRDATSSFRHQIEQIALSQGWRVERTEKGHWRFIPPDKSKRIVVLPGTSVSRSGVRNALADLRRSGLVVERD